MWFKPRNMKDSSKLSKIHCGLKRGKPKNGHILTKLWKHTETKLQSISISFYTYFLRRANQTEDTFADYCVGNNDLIFVKTRKLIYFPSLHYQNHQNTFIGAFFRQSQSPLARHCLHILLLVFQLSFEKVQTIFHVAPIFLKLLEANWQ